MKSFWCRLFHQGHWFSEWMYINKELYLKWNCKKCGREHLV